jgi:hypothetical protein
MLFAKFIVQDGDSAQVVLLRIDGGIVFPACLDCLLRILKIV